MLASLLDRLFDPKRLVEPDVLEEVFSYHFAGAGESWSAEKSPPWIYVSSKLHEIPAQGWKIHVSATPNTAADALAACIPLLLSAGASFKLVFTRRLLSLLNSPHASRNASGKLITVYPPDLATFRRLTPQLADATAGLAGPTILSDRLYRPGSPVYYRYGGFKSITTWDSDGVVVYAVRDASGGLISDERSVATRQPDWVEDPFADETPAAPPPPRGGLTVLLHERYAVTHAIRHANKGGVYVATDTATEKKVIIKEARPHIGEDGFGRDVTHRLEREAENLGFLSRLGVSPRPIELFKSGGHSFLALEWVEGQTLREFVITRRRSHHRPFPWRTLSSLAVKVTRILERCHRHNLIVRDFNPNNIMVGPAGRLSLIDVELVCRADEENPIGQGEGTPAYVAPESASRPDLATDFYSLGAVLFFIAALRDPIFPEDDPPLRPGEERIRACFERFAEEEGLPDALVAPVLANLQAAPEARWPPRRILDHLRRAGRLEQRPFTREPAPRRSARARRAMARTLASSFSRHIATSLDLSAPGRPMPASCQGERTHPCNVQYGTAGLGLALLASARADGDEVVREGVRGLCEWTLRFLRQNRRTDTPPGLYFGLAGTAWFLLAAADLLGDPGVREEAIELAAGLPTAPPRSDITHGAAGIGLALLRFHLATGDPRFLEGALTLAGHLSSFEHRAQGRLLWAKDLRAASPPGPEDLFYGFAHGAAGIGYFFLCLHLATADPAFLAVAGEAASTLCRAAVLRSGAAYWPFGPARETLWPHWCNGSSGAGTFLLRHALVTGDRAAFRLATLAARAVLRERWTSGLSQCHGLAGNGELLLDLHRFTGSRDFLEAAFDLGELIDLHTVLRPVGAIVPDDTGLPSADLGIGSAGIGMYFCRLATEAPRSLMLDDLLPQSRLAPRVTSSLWSQKHALAVGTVVDQDL